MSLPRTLVLTNDFPPRQGGIESFVEAVVQRLPPDRVVVYARGQAGDAAYDRGLPFRVVRHPRGIVLPEPSVARAAAALAREEGCRAAWVAAAAPLGLLAPALRRAVDGPVVATTHGHEVWWARVPGARRVLRAVGDGVDALTVLGPWTGEAVGAALSDAGRRRLHRLAPGVDLERFSPHVDGGRVRARHGLGDRPVVVCVSRLVPRKGQDTLLRAWPQVLAAVPEAALLLVGGGTDAERLRGLAAGTRSVVLTGPVPLAELPEHYAAGDVFAMPCRSRRAGLEVEGLGMVYLEAAACGLPVVAGDSGGAPEAVLHGRTGFVVPGASVDETARRVIELLADPERARAMGRAGRAWVERAWSWERTVGRLEALLSAQE
ncbi:phosphatidylinositol alpha-1,6-mannosyltransferase [Motilibacter rhizosphaerae]|uniref:Phosphatidylinositol alpha-1,6-mannosyltransferase n=1 Tax=Motilibacter rhizosphaerae TaxID=598652 RepID=A0A4Q7NR57_9ACTN|nr:glycosyltransferase family 4 protein [Motilibacter rhizosphaerae]RZS89537.1 phosphatidylinositol alpha-1,6-mannosyltransferase [Motilibacter rhizosphaerae]